MLRSTEILLVYEYSLGIIACTYKACLKATVVFKTRFSDCFDSKPMSKASRLADTASQKMGGSPESLWILLPRVARQAVVGNSDRRKTDHVLFS